jgi:rubrerythrin
MFSNNFPLSCVTKRSISSTFKRTIEDFICEVCSTAVKGNGYTNHCPKCLYSKHVDINPGDRASNCCGIMRPIAKTYNKKKGVVIYHKCQKCGAVKKNKTSSLDASEAIDKLPWEYRG